MPCIPNHVCAGALVGELTDPNLSTICPVNKPHPRQEVIGALGHCGVVHSSCCSGAQDPEQCRGRLTCQCVQLLLKCGLEGRCLRHCAGFEASQDD